jgi:hypothetical protein
MEDLPAREVVAAAKWLAGWVRLGRTHPPDFVPVKVPTGRLLRGLVVPPDDCLCAQWLVGRTLAVGGTNDSKASGTVGPTEKSSHKNGEPKQQ